MITSRVPLTQTIMMMREKISSGLLLNFAVNDRLEDRTVETGHYFSVQVVSGKASSKKRRC